MRMYSRVLLRRTRISLNCIVSFTSDHCLDLLIVLQLVVEAFKILVKASGAKVVRYKVISIG